MSIWIKESAYLPPGQMAMERNREIVWVGPVGSPISDAEFDGLVMHPSDIAKLKLRMDAHNSRADIISALLNQ